MLAAFQMTNRQAFVDYIGVYGEIGVGMPCGEKAAFAAIEDLPHASVPCPCGDEDHWLVKYEEEPFQGKAAMTFTSPPIVFTIVDNPPLGISDYLKGLEGSTGAEEEPELTPGQRGALTRQRNREANKN